LTNKQKSEYKIIKSKPNYVCYKIPHDWDVKCFGEICGFQRGLSYSSSDLDDENGNYLINLLCYKIGGGFKNGIKFYTGEEKSNALLNENDVVFAITEVTLKAEIIGYPLLVPALDGRKVFHTMDTCKIQPKIKILNEYLYYFMCTLICHKSMHAFSSATTVMHLNLYSVKKIHIPIPPFEEQQKITSILSTVDDLINKYDSIIESTKHLEIGLIRTLLTKGISHKTFKKVKWHFGKEIEIPETWESERLGDVSEMIVPMRDKPKIFDGEIPWLRIEDLDGKYVSDSKSNKKVSQKTIQEMNLKVFPIGTVLCSCSATIGECAITSKELITNQRFIGIYPNEKLNKEFLYYFLKTKKNDLIKIGTGGVHLYISRDFFEKFPMIIPPMNEQQKITSLLSKVDEKITDLETKKMHLKHLKKGLMQKLLTGQIRV